MNNGQTKPGYNLQISAENQFITDFALFHNPTDTLTLIPFLNSFLGRYGHLPSVAVADSGYGSEENYRFMDEAGMEAYVKYNRFHIEQRPRYKPNPFHHGNFHYNAAEDYYVCPMGQHIEAHRHHPFKDRKRLLQRKRTLPGAELSRLPAAVPVLQGRRQPTDNRGKPSAQRIQAQGQGTADIGGRTQTPGPTVHRTRGRLRTDEVQHGIPPLPPLRQRQGHDGLCLLRHSLQYQENVLEDSETDRKRGKYTPFRPVFTYIPFFIA